VDFCSHQRLGATAQGGGVRSVVLAGGHPHYRGGRCLLAHAPEGQLAQHFPNIFLDIRKH
jgi:hypothetical protein